jgi:O-antigen ligase
MGLQFGNISNSNDFAAHLLAVLPFLVWLGTTAENRLLRALSLVGAVYGLYVIFSTASRGALVALAGCFLVYIYRAEPTQRMFAILLTPVILLGIILATPHRAMNRILSFSAGGDASVEALESRENREYLLRQSINYTFRRPIFGVGPGQFPSFEGRNNQIIGDHGRWQETHNTYTQISSEVGIPALIFYLGAIFAGVRAANRVFREARGRPECRDLQASAAAIVLAITGFGIASTFLSLAYFIYMPVLTGLAVALERAAAAEFRKRPFSPPPNFAW